MTTRKTITLPDALVSDIDHLWGLAGGAVSSLGGAAIVPRRGLAASLTRLSRQLPGNWTPFS